LRKTILELAPSDLRVLIRGETGTGKERVAESLHLEGRRPSAAYVVINCAELTPTLAPSALFGHVKGAYTDARSDRRGVFELASGGTLFFDEIGDLSFDLQGMLLRVLETGVVTPVGAERAIRTSFRFLSATHRDLNLMAEKGEFRRDLLHRIAEATIFVPPLRTRCDDVALLARHFLSEAAREGQVEPAVLEEAAIETLMRYPWPGNVRELKNQMRLQAIRHPGQAIRPQDLALDPESALTVESEESRIVLALREAGTIAGAAKVLGVHRSTLWRRMSVLGIHQSKRPRVSGT
jgi:DNA-binding NtrC family response regulator